MLRFQYDQGYLLKGWSTDRIKFELFLYEQNEETEYRIWVPGHYFTWKCPNLKMRQEAFYHIEVAGDSKKTTLKYTFAPCMTLKKKLSITIIRGQRLEQLLIDEDIDPAVAKFLHSHFGLILRECVMPPIPVKFNIPDEPGLRNI